LMPPPTTSTSYSFSVCKEAVTRWASQCARA
jgi:hypothetical protein